MYMRTRGEFLATTVRTRKILLLGLVPRIREERLIKWVIFGEMVEGKVYPGGQDKESTGYPPGERLQGVCHQGRRMGRSCQGTRQVVEGAEGFMKDWYDKKMENTAARYRKAAHAAPIVPRSEGGRAPPL